jgi:hypothetical protein
MPERVEIVTGLILGRPMCGRCLATRSGLRLAELDAALVTIETTLVLHRATDRCEACGIIDIVFSLVRPA